MNKKQVVQIVDKIYKYNRLIGYKVYDGDKTYDVLTSKLKEIMFSGGIDVEGKQLNVTKKGNVRIINKKKSTKNKLDRNIKFQTREFVHKVDKYGNVIIGKDAEKIIDIEMKTSEIKSINERIKYYNKQIDSLQKEVGPEVQLRSKIEPIKIRGNKKPYYKFSSIEKKLTMNVKKSEMDDLYTTYENLLRGTFTSLPNGEIERMLSDIKKIPFERLVYMLSNPSSALSKEYFYSDNISSYNERLKQVNDEIKAYKDGRVKKTYDVEKNQYVKKDDKNREMLDYKENQREKQRNKSIQVEQSKVNSNIKNYLKLKSKELGLLEGKPKRKDIEYVLNDIFNPNTVQKSLSGREITRVKAREYINENFRPLKNLSLSELKSLLNEIKSFL